MNKTRTAFITALLSLALAPAADAASWQRYSLDSDRCYDAATLDRSGNGYPETILYDVDNDCRWDVTQYNTVGSDNFHEVRDFDMDENGRLEYRVSDGDQRVGFDYISYDLDQSGNFDSVNGRWRFVIPGSNIDYRTRINTNNANNSILWNFRNYYGVSLLYPSFSPAY